MRGAKTQEQASPALQSLMREYDAEAWIAVTDGKAKLYGHYADGRQYAVAVTREQIAERARMVADLEAEEVRRERR
jgi:hypothetical protein